MPINRKKARTEKNAASVNFYCEEIFNVLPDISVSLSAESDTLIPLKTALKILYQDKQARIAACRSSLLLFSLIYFPYYHLFRMPPFHLDMYADLSNDDLVGLLWIMFRESAKTSLIKIKLIHNIVYEKKKYNIWVSFDEKKAASNLYDVALQLQTNQKLIADFGQLFYDEELTTEKYSKKKSIKEFITSNWIKVKAYSTGMSIRGEVYAENRPDWLIMDDIETMKTIVSDARTKQVIDFIDEAITGLSGYATLVVLGNRLINNGSIAYIEDKIKGEAKWVVRDVRIIENSQITWSDKYVLTDKEAEEANWTIRDKRKQVISLETKRRLLGDTVFNREMMNQPLSDEEREIKLAWLQHIFTEDTIKTRLRNRYIMIDVADSKARRKADPDYTGTVIVDWDMENNWFVTYVHQDRLNNPELINWIFYLWQTYKPIKIGIEKQSLEDQVLPYVKTRIEETDIFPVIEELRHGGFNKEDRIRGALQGRLQAGKIFFRQHSQDHTDELKRQLFDFPKAKHDDLSDALAYLQQFGARPLIAQKMDFMTQVDKEFFEYKKKLRGGPKLTQSMRKI